MRQAARDHDALFKLIDQASTQAGRQDLNLLKALGAAHQRFELIPQAKAWYRLALTRDPIDSDVQQALYRLGSATARPERRTPDQPVNACLGKVGGFPGPSG